jgi:hypothetical protein
MEMIIYMQIATILSKDGKNYCIQPLNTCEVKDVRLKWI